MSKVHSLHPTAIVHQLAIISTYATIVTRWGVNQRHLIIHLDVTPRQESEQMSTALSLCQLTRLWLPPRHGMPFRNKRLTLNNKYFSHTQPTNSNKLGRLGASKLTAESDWPINRAPRTSPKTLPAIIASHGVIRIFLIVKITPGIF